MIRYLLDTNICIYTIKRRPESVFQKFMSLPVGSVAISTITYSELCLGVAKSAMVEKNTEALALFVSPLEIVSFGKEMGPVYGNLRNKLEKVGLVIGSLDMFIAAHALCLDCILVTNNTREFERIQGLKLENWAE